MNIFFVCTEIACKICTTYMFSDHEKWRVNCEFPSFQWIKCHFRPFIVPCTTFHPCCEGKSFNLLLGWLLIALTFVDLLCVCECKFSFICICDEENPMWWIVHFIWQTKNIYYMCPFGNTKHYWSSDNTKWATLACNGWGFHEFETLIGCINSINFSIKSH